MYSTFEKLESEAVWHLCFKKKQSAICFRSSLCLTPACAVLSNPITAKINVDFQTMKQCTAATNIKEERKVENLLFFSSFGPSVWMDSCHLHNNLKTLRQMKNLSHANNIFRFIYDSLSSVPFLTLTPQWKATVRTITLDDFPVFFPLLARGTGLTSSCLTESKVSLISFQNLKLFLQVKKNKYIKQRALNLCSSPPDNAHRDYDYRLTRLQHISSSVEAVI